MTTPDTILFLGFFALALWRRDRRILAMTGIVGVAAGLTAVSLAPSPWVGLAVAIFGAALIVHVLRALWAERRAAAAESAVRATAEDGRS